MKALVVSLLLGLGTGCAASSGGSPGDENRPPNIVLILADDLGHEVLNSYGGTSYRTPHLDRLAAEGMRFENAYATPLCTPTRVRLMTGKYNFRNYERFGYLSPRERTFANHLQEAGYATAMAGKWQLGGDEATPYGFGFDEYLLWQLVERNNWTRYKDPVLTRSGAGTDTLRGRYGPDVLLEFVEGFIERHREEPFLVYYSMVLPHSPFAPPPGHPAFASHPVMGTNDTVYFPAVIEYMDGIVGRLMRRLEELDLRDNTLVLFVGDNGTDRGVVSRMGDRLIQGRKAHTTDAGTHVPLIASWPGVVAPGAVRNELVDVGDLFPAILDAAGVRSAPEFPEDAISLYPTLSEGARHPRRWIFRDYNPMWGRWEPRRYAQDTRYKLYAKGEFYDFVQDPLEQDPLGGAQLAPEARRARSALQAVLERTEVEIVRQKSSAR